ncbi:MAG TPA: hypothetical protein VFS00_04505, partial [Polyangiaceae bacterium]|nr:hypothetical protein [Polyangiaceae bacterium]
EAARGGAANAPSARKGAPNAAALADEVAHLARARALAASDPAAALRLADEGHRSFSRGVLYPEREALAIDCLRRSGRRGEAQARAQRFVKRFPRSPFAEKIRRENGLEASTDRLARRRPRRPSAPRRRGRGGRGLRGRRHFS